MKISKEFVLVFVQEKAKDGRQNTNQGHALVPQAAPRENGKGKKSEQRSVSIGCDFENNTDHAVAGNPFVY